MSTSRIAVLALLVTLFAPGVGARAAPDEDAFVAGYATAILSREFGLEGARVSVVHGVVRVEARRIPGAEREKLEAVLGGIPGVAAVELTEVDGTAPPQVPGPVAAASDNGMLGSRGLELLPKRELFDPLLADPRWPHFAASQHFYLDDDELTRVAGVSFGESIPLLGFDMPGPGRGELGFQAAVFSIFDLDSDSFDLVNSDFLVGLTGAWRRGRFSMLARVLHQSSHLGDEFLLRSRVDRINVSYESLDVLLSFEPWDFLRVYGGGGALLRRDPEDLERGLAQGGFELVSPRAFLAGHVRPLLALDVQGREESGWEADLSLRAGVQIESPSLLSQRLQILLEYYDGRSPNGQFFRRELEYLGLGAHLHF